MDVIFTLAAIVMYVASFTKNMEPWASLGYVVIGSVFLVGGVIIRRLK